MLALICIVFSWAVAMDDLDAPDSIAHELPDPALQQNLLAFANTVAYLDPANLESVGAVPLIDISETCVMVPDSAPMSGIAPASVPDSAPMAGIPPASRSSRVLAERSHAPARNLFDPLLELEQFLRQGLRPRHNPRSNMTDLEMLRTCVDLALVELDGIWARLTGYAHPPQRFIEDRIANC